MGVRADFYERSLKAAYPAHLFSTVAKAFFRGLAVVAELMETKFGSAQAQDFVDFATDIWLRAIAEERGVEFPAGIGDQELRDAIHLDRDTVTPNGMTAAVAELMHQYSDAQWTDPPTISPEPLLFEWADDGGYCHPTGSVDDEASMFCGHLSASAGPVYDPQPNEFGRAGHAGFEFLVEGLDIGGGSYCHATGSVDDDASCFSHATSSGTLDGFTTGPNYAHWAILNAIAAGLESWKAHNVPAHMQTRGPPRGVLQNPNFVLGAGGGASPTWWTTVSTQHIAADDGGNPLDEGRMLVMSDSVPSEATSGSVFVGANPVSIRVEIDARRTVGNPLIRVAVLSVTQGKYWKQTDRSWSVALSYDEIVGIPAERTRATVFVDVPLPAGEEFVIYVTAAVAGSQWNLYHVRVVEEP